MDIQDIHNRFDISVKKLRRMEREGVFENRKIFSSTVLAARPIGH